MPRPILRRSIVHLSAWLLLAIATPVAARGLTAKIDRVKTAVATLENVEVRLDWPADADRGELTLRVARVEAADLGYRFRDLQWRCPLLRAAAGGWRCDGALRSSSGAGAPLRLSVDLAAASTDAALRQGKASFALHRDVATPDDTVLDLTRVPLAWVQALLSQAWADGRLTGGTLSGHLTVRTPAKGPLRVEGPLELADAALDTPDASIAAQGIGARLRIDYRKLPSSTLVAVEGELRGGEFLVGGTYVVLPHTPVRVGIDAMQRGAEGWEFPTFSWSDGDALTVDGSAALSPGLDVQQLDLTVRSADLSLLPARYLSGPLGVMGLPDLAMQGALDASVSMRNGALLKANARLGDVSLDAPGKRLSFTGLAGDLRLSEGAAVDSALRWRSGTVSGIPFGAATLPLRSANGTLVARAPLAIPMLDGRMVFDTLTLTPPAADAGLRISFGLTLDALDIGALSTSLGGPAFRGKLSGNIPAARYADDRIDFDGGLSMQAFGGSIAVSALSAERPFGVAPTLSADLQLKGLDLIRLTEVFDFGNISGRLEGRIDDLRLVDWTPVAFDADLHTVRVPGVRQRISQRAVQNISSVGDTSFVSSLQGRLIGLFDDFGYARIGISCRLSNEVCAMGGLRPAGDGFTIVEGAGIPRLDVVGFNRSVDWPTLVERIGAVGSGDVKPVFE